MNIKRLLPSHPITFDDCWQIYQSAVGDQLDAAAESGFKHGFMFAVEAIQKRLDRGDDIREDLFAREAQTK